MKMVKTNCCGIKIPYDDEINRCVRCPEDDNFVCPECERRCNNCMRIVCEHHHILYNGSCSTGCEFENMERIKSGRL